MSVLRDNKESLMAVLEAFVYDPLINWRLMQTDVDGRRPDGERSRIFEVSRYLRRCLQANTTARPSCVLLLILKVLHES